MPYDITDAMKDIAQLYHNQETMYKKLVEKGVLEKEKEDGKRE